MQVSVCALVDYDESERVTIPLSPDPHDRHRRVQAGSVPIGHLHQHNRIVPLLLPQGISSGGQPLRG